MSGAPTLDAICAWIFDATGVARREMAERNSTPRVVDARDLAVWGVRTVGGVQYSDISRALGHERRFALRAYERAVRRILADAEYRQLAARLWARFALGDEARSAL